jgi:hypothetical protein
MTPCKRSPSAEKSIRVVIQLLCAIPELNRSKPDLLVHVPGTMARNLLAIEVKSINTPTEKFVEDLRTLAAFLAPGGDYAGGVCLV